MKLSNCGAAHTFTRKNKKRGQRTFLECGALDGVKHSRTLHMERFLNWTGVLIESDDKFFTEMKLAHRKAYGVQACISIEEHPTIEDFIATPVQFKINGINRIIVNDAPGYVPKHNLRGMALKLRNLVTGEPVQAQCLPLYSILLAVNISVIDLMVLDSKSVEFEVLKTIPFQKIDIAVLLIEIYRKPKYQKEITHAYLKSQGYIYYDSFHNALYPGDDIFLNEKYLKKGVSLTNLSLSNYFKILTGKEKKEAPESEFESFENYFLPILV
ncbi:uncharacterized protein LOC136043788 isoform X2 [Artemia franciscana]|uniref:uncharacterized protein LOC136043788 isoform X2 n=1 Tax=Artemia franciscana TaxID=6661 RepID=UPI0032DAB633